MSRFVPVLVPAEDQAACGSDLQEAQRKTGLACDLEKSAQQRGAAADFVRLYGATNQFAQHCLVMFDNTQKPGPEIVTIAIAARRWITVSKLRRLLPENEAVHRSQKAQSQRRVGRIVVMTMQNGRAHAPSPNILSSLVQ